jgi:hypothetical protein
MRELEATLDEVFLRQERLTRDEIQRRAVAAAAPVDVINALDGLPEGEYAQEEVAEALLMAPSDTSAGIPPEGLDDNDFLRELWEIHRTRHDTLRHGSDDALANHTDRMAELEAEYLRRFPAREIDPSRLRPGARATSGREDSPTGAEQPWEPRDFAIAAGKDPTPENIEWARRVLEKEGPAAIERIVP